MRQWPRHALDCIGRLRRAWRFQHARQSSGSGSRAARRRQQILELHLSDPPRIGHEPRLRKRPRDESRNHELPFAVGERGCAKTPDLRPAHFLAHRAIEHAGDSQIESLRDQVYRARTGQCAAIDLQPQVIGARQPVNHLQVARELTMSVYAWEFCR